MSDPTGGSRPEDLLAGLDRARPLPPGLRDRLEDELVAARARPRALEPDLAAALTEALSRPTVEDEEAAELLSGLDGARALPEAMAGRLAARLEAGVPRWRPRPIPRRWVGAGIAAAALLALGVTGLELHHSSQIRPTASSDSRASATTFAGQAPTAGAGGGTGGSESAGGVSASNGGNASAVGAGSATGASSAAPAPAGSPLYAASGAPPRVASVSPVEGPVTGGNTVVIRGAGFTSTTAVRFGSVRAAHVVAISDFEIRAVVPPHSPGTVFVVVVTANGSSPTGSGSRYSFTG